MKILQVHNFYQQRGGEDQVCAAEHRILTDHGHQVHQYLVHNDAIKDMSSASLAVRTVWNDETYCNVERLIQSERPDVIHAHNTFPLISPSLYYAADAESVPVVQTLHNYRLLCPAATLFRDGHICEECLGDHVPFRSVLHGCYRGSRPATAVAASMLAAHRLAQTWTRKVEAFIAVTNFSKQKFIQGGLPADKIVVRPNCLARDPGKGNGDGGYALFAGRLTEEKGVRTLLKAWDTLAPTIPLKIAGEGPLSEWLGNELLTRPRVEWLGHCDREALMSLLQKAAFVVFPSEHYENLPMIIIEAFACGTPVVVSRLGSIPEIVQDRANGLHFEAGDVNDLIERVKYLLSDSHKLAEMRGAARGSYEDRYAALENYRSLIGLYQSVIRTYGQTKAHPLSDSLRTIRS